MVEEYGGVTGYQNGNNAITNNCYNLKKITGKREVGGITGNNSKGTTSNCYNAGELNGTTNVYSVVGGGGANTGSTITNCYYLSTLSTTDNYATPKSDAEMKAAAFVTLLNTGQADAPWKLDENINQGYPIFKWQK